MSITCSDYQEVYNLINKRDQNLHKINVENPHGYINIISAKKKFNRLDENKT